ncbi:hypothetical protein IEQ34_025170 [Dendrobium chrysotoxum]|uniref:Zn-dependent exopeptidase n=1 Tax=Dendrobium chrysotoxum TaxID=161865 RepID=A0AAV7FJ43_DENCH|nr:hypothetical protein IEQ34_025170 [Dendrobium chrysotoxum]
MSVPAEKESLLADEKHVQVFKETDIVVYDREHDDVDEASGDAFERAANCSVRQRLKVFFVACYFVWLYFAFIRHHLPSIPLELKPGSLRPGKGWAYSIAGHHGHHHGKHHHHQPCRNEQHAQGYLKNVLAAARHRAELTSAKLPNVSGHLSDPSTLEKIFEKIFLSVPSAEGARENLRSLTRTTHEAGSKADYRTAIDVLEQWGTLLGADLPDNREDLVFEAGSSDSIRYMTGTRDDEWKAGHPLGKPRVWVDTYSVWLNYPKTSSLHLSKANETNMPYFRAPLAEDVLRKDPTSIDGLPPFHGYSKSGRASGPLVNAGSCSREDFNLLREKGVNVTGAITLCRYGGSFRGLKVRLSAENGAVGTLIYSDPIEDGEVTQANGYLPYPEGPARQPSSVQRGSVQAISIYPVPFLQAVAQRGVKADDLSDSFKGAVPGVPEYWTGPSDDIVSLDNQMTDISDAQDIWNTYALIPGVIEDEIVIVSNHRDAWTFGAGDPSSGTATLHEVVAGLGALVEKGWRPMRTILLASWDAEEYGLIGSTEAAEDYPNFFKDKATLFINTDVAVRGGQLKAAASPSLTHYIVKAASDVKDPNGSGSPLHIPAARPLGSGSDYTAYLQNLGIASLDVGFDRRPTDPVYHYHSNYDSFYWMDKFGDPEFARHHAAAQFVGLLILRGAQSVFLPINVTAYANELDHYLGQVRKLSASDLDVSKVEKAIDDIKRSAQIFDAEKARTEKKLHKLLSQKCIMRQAAHKPSKELRKVFGQIKQLNRRAKLFETGFLSQDGKGLINRPFYQHLGVAPGRFLGYGATTFPGVTESITLDSGKGVDSEIARLVESLHAVRRNLDKGDHHP